MKPPKQKIYLSGPMRGYDDLNYPLFMSAEEFVNEYYNKQYEIVNPAVLCPATMDARDALRVDYNALGECSFILFLPGYQASEGARVEYMIARSLGILPWYLVQSRNDWDILDISWEEADERGLTPVEDNAWRLVHGPRNASYGPPTADFLRTAQMRGGLHGREEGPRDVAMDMALLKLSRLVATPTHVDSLVDAIGYLLCYDRIVRDH